MSEGPAPPGSTTCPHCQRAVPLAAPYCPACGFGLPQPRRRVPMGRGLSWMIGGLIMLGLAGFVFFATCLGGVGGGGSVSQIGMMAAAVLALGGVVVMGVGVVMSLLELRR